MTHVKVEGGEAVAYPYRRRDLVKDNPAIGFPRDLTDVDLSGCNVFPVVEADPPEVTLLQRVRHAELPIQNDQGEWQTNWVVSDLPSDQIERLIIEERERRLAEGFDYDFGDDRGVHRIATTEADMEKWREVTDSANAMINLSQGQNEITIATETGAVTITAMEWQSILVAAGEFRQPVYLASFALMAMEQTPSDFTNEVYWAKA